MTLVIVAAAIGAAVLLLAIVALSRSRFADESERFRYVSDLTSTWSRQQADAARRQGSAHGGETAADAAASSERIDPGRIDLREREGEPQGSRQDVRRR